MALAILAQGALYLGLRHVAVATWPSWAHHRLAHGSLPWPGVVSTDIVTGTREAGGAPPLPPLTLMPPPPPMALPMPDLNRPGTVATPSG